MTIVVTGFSPKGFEQYGRRFSQSFKQYWPKQYKLIAATEQYEDMGVGQQFSLSAIEKFTEFKNRHNNDLKAFGKVRQPCWKNKEADQGYSYRTDAMKFSRVPFIIQYVAESMKNDHEFLVWLDGDTYTFRHIPENFIESLMPEWANVVYLGRTDQHSECGFVIFRLPQAMQLINEMAAYYDSDLVFHLDEWHNSYVFDYVRNKLLVPSHSLTSGRGHVWHTCVLRQYMDHLKGERRKIIGYSRERVEHVG